jgi:molybdopterin-containing oxidoreductase family membrane subunit
LEASQFPKGDFRAPVPVIQEGHSYRSVTDKLTNLVLTPNTPVVWFAIMGVAFILLTGLAVSVSYLLLKGIGIWGNNIPVGWAFDIINFVWWIGIGHAGTLISAILLLFKQDWRTSINRFAEADDALRRAVRGVVPVDSYRPSRGLPRTGCSRTRTRWGCGRTSAAR